MEPLSLGFNTPVGPFESEVKTSAFPLENWGPVLDITIPGRPPSWNRAYRARGGGIIYMTRDAKAWKEHVEAHVSWVAKAARWKAVDKKRTVIDIWAQLKRPMDADNMLKLTIDSVATAIQVNDRAFLPRVWDMQFGKEPEYIRLIVVQEK